MPLNLQAKTCRVISAGIAACASSPPAPAVSPRWSPGQDVDVTEPSPSELISAVEALPKRALSERADWPARCPSGRLS
jgi:hypothetical protein